MAEIERTEEVKYSLVIPVYGNEENIPYLIPVLKNIAQSVDGAFEVIFVIDASPDRSKELILGLANGFQYQVICHSRNFGSFVAIRTGIEHAQGKYIAVMAADLQEPPELIIEFFSELNNNTADILFGKRESRDDPWLKTVLSNFYWAIYRKFIQPDIPQGGVDIFAINENAKNELVKIKEPNSSLIAQLFWLGFRRKVLSYQRKKREHGVSTWNLSKRIRYMIDSIFSYSDVPIMFILWVGVISLFMTFSIGVVTAVSRLLGLIDVPGYAAIILVLLFIGSIIIFILGVLGCYIWRAFENTKRRPLSIISEHKRSNEGF
jgi:glycosyltransferase involved in cell wall biosynthesis